MTSAIASAFRRCLHLQSDVLHEKWLLVASLKVRTPNVTFSLTTCKASLYILQLWAVKCFINYMKCLFFDAATFQILVPDWLIILLYVMFLDLDFMGLVSLSTSLERSQ